SEAGDSPIAARASQTRRTPGSAMTQLVQRAESAQTRGSRINRLAADACCSERARIQSTQCAVADQWNDTVPDHRVDREGIGDLRADQQSANVGSCIGLGDHAAYDLGTGAEQQRAETELTRAACSDASQEYQAVGRLCGDDRSEQPLGSEPVEHLAGHAGEEVDDPAVLQPRPLGM